MQIRTFENIIALVQCIWIFKNFPFPRQLFLALVKSEVNDYYEPACDMLQLRKNSLQIWKLSKNIDHEGKETS